MKRRKMRNKFSKQLSVLPTKPNERVKYDKIYLTTEHRLCFLVSATGTGKTTSALDYVKEGIKGIKRIIIDDINHVLEGFFSSSNFYSKEERINFFKALRKLYDSGANFIFLDDEIQPHHVRFIEAFFGEKAYLTLNEYKPKERPLTPYATKVQLTDRLNQKLAAKPKGETIACYAASKRTGQRLAKLFGKKYRVLNVNEETIDVDSDVQRAVEKCDFRKYDLVVYSKELGIGYDINVDYIKTVFGFFDYDEIRININVKSILRARQSTEFFVYFGNTKKINENSLSRENLLKRFNLDWGLDEPNQLSQEDRTFLNEEGIALFDFFVDNERDRFYDLANPIEVYKVNFERESIKLLGAIEPPLDESKEFVKLWNSLD